MRATTTISEEQLRAMLAGRSGLDADALWYPVYDVPRAFGLRWPLSAEQAERVLGELIEGLRRVLPAPLPDDPDRHAAAGRGQRYVYLAEITDRYENCQTRRILERIMHAGVTPADPSFGGESYDPRSERGWGARPSAAADLGGTPDWAWWRTVRAAGPRPFYRMPDPFVGQGDPPVDRAIELRESTANAAAYRRALAAAVREDPRMVDCWAHLGIDALERAETDPGALREALGYYQTAVAVAELSLPPGFSGVLAWSELDNRPFHRGLHGLGLSWWRLGDMPKATAVFGNCLFTNPDDNQGVRYLIGETTAGVPWHRRAGDELM